MLITLIILFLSVPLLELTILLYLARAISVWGTLLLVLATGVLGASLARFQGWRTCLRIKQEIASGRMPTGSLLDAAMIFLAGALLLTPGILTDLVGFSLLVPQCRRFYRQSISQYIRRRFHLRTFTSPEVERRDEIIDVDVEPNK